MRLPDDERATFLAERRAVSAQRYDTLHSAHYDEHWGDIAPSHARYVRRLIERLPTGAAVLDAGCGTGKYWPDLLAAGCHVLGVDQSAGMLARANAKHPDVPTQVLALQDLTAAENLRDRFDGLLCVDVLENVGPEDWPGVAGGLGPDAARRGERVPHGGAAARPAARRLGSAPSGGRTLRRLRLPLLPVPAAGQPVAEHSQVRH